METFTTVAGKPAAPSISRAGQHARTGAAVVAIIILWIFSRGIVVGTLANYEKLTGQYETHQFSWAAPRVTLRLPESATSASLTIVGRAPSDQHWTLDCGETLHLSVDIHAGTFRQSLPLSPVCHEQGLTIQSDWATVPAAGIGSRDTRSLSYQVFDVQSGADHLALEALLAHSNGLYGLEPLEAHSDPQGVLTERWDSTWYWNIAQNGYQFNGDNRVQQNVAWPFLFPTLVKAISSAGNISVASAMVQLNAGLMLIALLILFAIGRASGLTRSLSLIAPAWLSFNPFAFFLVGGFSESLFLALECLLVLLLLRRKYAPAALTVALLTSTRFVGLIGFAWLAITLWRDPALRGRGRLWRIAIAGAVGVLGVIADIALKWAQTGHPLAAFTVRASWQTTSFSALRGFFQANALFQGDYLMALLPAALLAGYAVFIAVNNWRRAGDDVTRLLVGAGVSLVGATLILNPEIHSAGRYFLPFAPTLVGLLRAERQPGRVLPLILIATAAGAAFMPFIALRIAMGQPPF